MKEWLYYLTTEDGKSYAVVNGIVQKKSQRTPLTYTPDGWQDISIGWERDMNKIGIVRNFSIPLGFVLDGADILRNIVYKESIESKVFLVIQKLDVQLENGLYKFAYEYFYKGEIDLSSFKDDGVKVTVNILEGGLSKLLKANEGTVYEISLDEPEAITVKMDGVYLTQRNSWLMIADADAFDNRVVPMQFLNSEGAAFGIAAFSVFEGAITADNYFLTSAQDITGLRIKGKISVNIDPVTDSGNVKRVIKNSAGTIVATLVDVAANHTSYTEVNVDVTFNVEAGEKYYLVSLGGAWSGHKEAQLEIEFKSRYRTSYVKAYKPFDLFRKLVHKITGNADQAVSALLLEKADFVLTSGDAVRGIAGAKIKTSLNQFFEDCKVRYAAGMGIENDSVVIEPYEHFLDESDPIYLGNAKDLNVSIATDLMGNTFKFGYQEKQIDDVNGKYSFNNTHLYSSPITKVVKETSFVSPYTSDPYVIELTRVNFEGKTTTDSSKDNEVMILNVKEETESFSAEVLIYSDPLKGFFITGNESEAEKFLTSFNVSGTSLNNQRFTVATVQAVTGGFNVYTNEATQAEVVTATFTINTYTLNRPAFDSLTGVPDPATIFNVLLSPKRIAEAQRKWWQSIMTGITGELVFRTTEKNDQLKTVEGSVTIEERGNLEIKADKLFQTPYLELTIEVPVSLAEIMETNVNRAFSFTWENILYIGFLKKAGIAPNTNKEQAFKLLCAPSVDLKNLI